MRYTKHLPTPAAVGAWFAAYGRHVSRLHLRHLDAGSAAVGCVGEADLPALLAAAAGSLQQMTVQQCRVQVRVGGLAKSGLSRRSWGSPHDRPR